MKLDSNLAWRQTSAAISANLDVLLPLAGVFFLLPRLALALFMPEPELQQNMQPAEIAAALRAYYTQILPVAIPMMLLQAAGTLAMITLFTDRSRPTVGHAIRTGFRCMLPYVAAEILFAMAAGIIGGAVLSVGALLGPAVVLAGAAVLGGLAYGFVRLALVAPVIVTEGIGDPIRATVRSWRLTRGNGLRILVFLGLMTLVLLVLTGALVSVGGAVAAMAMGAEPARMISDTIASLLTAVYGAYVAAAIAAFHRQLAGPGDSYASRFE
ncbi:MAG TPA: hypothetical protein VN222_14710 [Novosphingobium sp.]|nr:hypothetical protein [Novosphingobium sp.]